MMLLNEDIRLDVFADVRLEKEHPQRVGPCDTQSKLTPAEKVCSSPDEEKEAELTEMTFDAGSKTRVMNGGLFGQVDQSCLSSKVSSKLKLSRLKKRHSRYQEVV